MQSALSYLTIVTLIFGQGGTGQDYEVADVKCYQVFDPANIGSVNKQSVPQQMGARLKKPDGFKGHPLFADDHRVNPATDRDCSIQSEKGDSTGRIYRMAISNFSRCGVTHHSGYVHVRIWFPLLPHVMTSQDQEVILVCKPPDPVVLSHRATEISSSSLISPGQARVTGVVEEESSKLEYQVAVYRHPDESLLGRAIIEPRPLISLPQSGTIEPRPLSFGSSTSSTTSSTISTAPAATRAPSGPYLVPVEEAVAIGTRLQLRATIKSDSAWKYAKLVEVTVSPDPQDPHAEGHVRLLHLGCYSYRCRNPEMKSLMRGQARRVPARPSEVWLDFEAFLLAANYSSDDLTRRNKGQQWIHTTVLACVEEKDCRADMCGDPVDPAGFGRRKRATRSNNGTEVQFDNRVAIEIQIPHDGETDELGSFQDCAMWIVPLGLFVSTTITSLIVLVLMCRWNAQKKDQLAKLGLAPHTGTSITSSIAYRNGGFQVE